MVKNTKKKASSGQASRKPMGLPKTAAALKKHGFPRVPVNFDAMSANERKKWVSFANPRAGTVAMVRPASAGPTDERWFPTAERGIYIVCTYDPGSRNYDLNCHKVSASLIDPQHPSSG